MSEMTSPSAAYPATRKGKASLMRKIMVDLSIMTMIGIVLALIGPFGSFENPLPLRLVSWLVFSYIGYMIYSPMGVIVDRLHVALDLPRFGLWVAACLIATVPMSCVVWAMNFIPQHVPLPSIEQMVEHYFYVLVIGSGVTGLFNIIEWNNKQPVETETEFIATPAHEIAVRELPVDTAPRAEVASFFARLPPALGTDLLALEMEDHYVRAHTARGSDIILMRMRDAVAELGTLEGAQVHRSWWVARSAVDGTRREGRNIRLQLTGGLEAPVSRNMAPQLKQDDWW